MATNSQGDQPLGLTLRHLGTGVGGVDVFPDEQPIHHTPNRRAPPGFRHIDAVTRHPMSHATYSCTTGGDLAEPGRRQEGALRAMRRRRPHPDHHIRARR